MSTSFLNIPIDLKNHALRLGKLEWYLDQIHTKHNITLELFEDPLPKFGYAYPSATVLKNNLYGPFHLLFQNLDFSLTRQKLDRANIAHCLRVCGADWQHLAEKKHDELQIFNIDSGYAKDLILELKLSFMAATSYWPVLGIPVPEEATKELIQNIEATESIYQEFDSARLPPLIGEVTREKLLERVLEHRLDYADSCNESIKTHLDTAHKALNFARAMILILEGVRADPRPTMDKIDHTNAWAFIVEIKQFAGAILEQTESDLRRINRFISAVHEMGADVAFYNKEVPFRVFYLTNAPLKFDLPDIPLDSPRSSMA